MALAKNDQMRFENCFSIIVKILK